MFCLYNDTYEILCKILLCHIVHDMPYLIGLIAVMTSEHAIHIISCTCHPRLEAANKIKHCNYIQCHGGNMTQKLLV